MTPFNLQAALDGEPVVTRNGTKVTTVAFFPTLPVMRQVIYAAENSSFPREVDINGHYFPNHERDSSFDLFMKGPRTRTAKVVQALPDVNGDDFNE